MNGGNSTEDNQKARPATLKVWSKHPLGEPRDWPASLKNAVQIVRSNPQPSVLLWGDNKFCFFNDAYLNHCGYLFQQDDAGTPAAGLFGIKWNLIEPRIIEVFTTGEIVFDNPQEFIPLFNLDAEWTPYSFVPWRDESQNIVAVMVHCSLRTESGRLFKRIETIQNDLSLAIETAELGIWEYDPNEDFLIVNDILRGWFGMKSTSVPLTFAVTCIVEADRQRVIDQIEEALKYENGGEYSSAYAVKNVETGEIRQVLARGRAYFDEQGVPLVMKGTIQNVTEALKSRQQTRQTEQKLNLALEASGLAFFEMFPSTSQINYSTRLTEIFGMEHDREHTHADFRRKVYPEDVPVILKSLRESFQTGEYVYEVRIDAGRQEPVWIRTIGKVISDDKGIPEKIIGTVADVTESKQQEQKIQDSEYKMRTVLDTAPFPVAIYEGDDMTITYANRDVIELWQKGGDIIGKTFLEVLPELQGFEFFDRLRDVYRTGKGFEEKNREVIFNRNGVFETFYFNYNYTPLINAQGQVYGVLNTAFDVTDSVSAANRLKESEARFRLLADSLPQLIWASDRYGNIDYWNQATYEYCGVTDQELQWGNWMNVIHVDDRTSTLLLWKRAILTGTTFINEQRIKTAAGDYRWQLSRAHPLRNEKGKIIRWLGSSTDIHDLKEQEHKRDLFISMASHELKTPVTSAKAYTQVLLHKYAGSPDVFLLHSLEKIHKQIDKLTALINDLLDLTKIKTGVLSLRVTEVSFNEIVRDCLTEIHEQQTKHKIVFQDEKEELWIMADKERICQVVLNIMLNATKYSPEKSTITVKLETRDRHALLTIADEGIGIEKEHQEKIFERFYRAGGNGDNTYPGFGIGLYIVKDIVHRHGGDVGVESVPGEGSRFYVRLPLVQAPG